MKCHQCNHTVTRKSKFCPNCGEAIKPRTKEPRAPAHAGVSFGSLWLILFLGGIVLFAIFKLRSNTANEIGSPTQVQSLGIQDQAVLEIAAEFMCFCGTCNDRLDACTCDHKNGALEVKGFIAQKLQEGHQKPHVVEMVQARFGGLQPGLPPSLELPPINQSSRPN